MAHCSSKATLKAFQLTMPPESKAKALGKRLYDYNRVFRFMDATHKY